MMLAQTEFLQKRTQFCGLSYEQKPLLLSEISPFGTAIKKNEIPLPLAAAVPDQLKPFLVERAISIDLTSHENRDDLRGPQSMELSMNYPSNMGLTIKYIGII